MRVPTGPQAKELRVRTVTLSPLVETIIKAVKALRQIPESKENLEESESRKEERNRFGSSDVRIVPKIASRITHGDLGVIGHTIQPEKLHDLPWVVVVTGNSECEVRKDDDECRDD